METERRRVAIPVTYGLSVRYLVSSGLLRQLAEVCRPVVGVGWDDPDLMAAVEAEGAEAVRLPDVRFDHEVRRLHRLLGAGFERRLKSPTTAITRRWRRRAYPRSLRPLAVLRQARDRAVIRRPGFETALQAREPSAMRAGTNLAEFEAWLVDHHVEALLSITPYHEQDQLCLWAAAAAGLPSLAAIISFDNPTTRGRLSQLSDRILVWNRFNRNEVLRSYPGLDPDRVRVTGAPQFDLHHDPTRVLDEPTWRSALGLPPGRPVVLYGAGPGPLLPGEPKLVVAIDAAIGSGQIPGRPVILLRGHPADPLERWRGLDQLDHVVLSPGWGRADGGRSWPSPSEIDLQLSSLAHASVQVSICSTMAIDAAVFDRPVVAPTFLPGVGFSEQRVVRNFYRQEHWRPIADSGAVNEVGNLDDLIEAIRSHLEHPELGRSNRRAMVADLLTFPDGQAGERLVAELLDLLRAAGEPAA